MADVSVTEELPAPAHVVWSLIEDFGDMSAWSPDSKVIRSEGQGQGAVRTAESADGLYVERCESYSPESYSFQYTLVESPHPYEEYLGTVTLIEIDDQRCEVEWKSDFEMSGVKKEYVVDALIKTYRDVFIANLRATILKRQ